MARKLRIALEGLRQAFDDRSGEYSWVLDTETGEVLLLSEDSELPLSIEEIEEDQTGFLGIDPEDPREGYRDMEEFRRFKDVLIQAPQERERWFRFHGGTGQGPASGLAGSKWHRGAGGAVLDPTRRLG